MLFFFRLNFNAILARFVLMLGVNASAFTYSKKISPYGNLAP